MGAQTVKQVISALESARKLEQHLYRDNPDAREPLRLDTCIQELQRAAANNESSRVLTSQTLKAAGSSAGEVQSVLNCPVKSSLIRL